MAGKTGIKLGTIIDNFHLNVLYGPEGYREKLITIDDVNRPGLQLTGFFDYFDRERMQLLGLVEISYLEGITPAMRAAVFDKLFSYHTPAVIFARGLKPYLECMEMARKYRRTLLSTNDTTVVFTSKVIDYLNHELAATVTRHGVILDIYGEGVMIIGDSGIGKSETAIELVKRGHRLVADDAVDIRRVSNQLIGKAPELIRHYIELRGIGIIDLQQLFGMSAVKLESQIDLVVEMEPWVEGKFYDRFGLDELSMNVLGVELPKVLVPVRPGRNLAVICESAAINHRQKKMGYNAAQELYRRVQVAAMNNRHKRYGFNSAQQLADALMNQGSAGN